MGVHTPPPHPQTASGESTDRSSDEITPMWLVVVAVGALVVNVVARLAVAGPLSGREAVDLRIAMSSTPGLGEQLETRGAPPLFHVVLDAWTAVVGDGARAGRSLSLLLSLVAIPLSWWVGRRIGGRRLAVLCAFTVGLAPFCFRYGTEISAVPLVVCEVLVLWLCLPRGPGVSPSAIRLVAVAAASAALCWTTYWGVPLVAVAAVLWAWRGPGRSFVTCGALLVGPVSLLAWASSILDQTRVDTAPSIRPTSIVVTGLVELAGGPFPYTYVFLMVLLVVLVIGYGGVRLAPYRIRLDLSGTALGRRLGIIIVGTLCLGAVLGWLVPLMSAPASVAVVFPAAAVLAAIGVGSILAARGSIAVLVIIVVASAAGYESFDLDRTQFGDAVDAIERVDGDPVVVVCSEEAEAALELAGVPAIRAGSAASVVEAAGDRPIVLVQRVQPNRPDPACVRLAGELGGARTRIAVVAPDPTEFVEAVAVDEFR